MGAAAVAWPPDLEATVSQCSKSFFSIGGAVDLGHRVAGTPPQPATIAAGTKKAPSARVYSFVFILITRTEGSGSFVNRC